MSSAGSRASKITIRQGVDADIPYVAKFLSYSMYDSEMPAGQRKELIRLEQNDLMERYGSLVGRRKYTSVLFICEEDEEIIGCVGLDCQVLNLEARKLIKVRSTGSLDPDREKVVLVLANLAVRVDRRKSGIGRSLLASCYSFLEGRDEFDGIYLLVNADNKAARSLYSSRGFKELYVDEEATCVVSGSMSLKTEQCVNVCYRKAKQSKTDAGPDLLRSFISLFKTSRGK